MGEGRGEREREERGEGRERKWERAEKGGEKEERGGRDEEREEGYTCKEGLKASLSDK